VESVEGLSRWSQWSIVCPVTQRPPKSGRKHAALLAACHNYCLCHNPVAQLCNNAAFTALLTTVALLQPV
jgi:hypothetical protein